MSILMNKLINNECMNEWRTRIQHEHHHASTHGNRALLDGRGVFLRQLRGGDSGGRKFLHESRDVELSLASSEIHVTDLSEYGALAPPLVVYPTYAPHAADVSVRVTAVQLCAICLFVCLFVYG